MQREREDLSTEQRQAGLLETILRGCVAAALVMSVGNALGGPALRERVVMVIPLLVPLAAAWWLNRTGRVRTASRVFVWGAWAGLLVARLLAGGVRETALLWHFLVVLAAALLLGRGTALALACLSVAAALATIWAEEQGRVAASVNAPLAVVLSFSGVLLLSVFLLTAATSTIDEALREARRELAERREAASALEKSERTLRALLDATTETAFLLDESGTILATNAAIGRWSGRDPAQMVGLNAYDMLPPSLAATRRAQIEQVIQDGRPRRFDDQGADGRQYDNTVFPVADESGRVTRVAVFARDVTEVKAAQEALERALHKLARLDKAKSDFIALAAHELRTPVTLVLGYSDLIESAAERGETARSLVGSLRHGAGRLRLVVEEMLDVARLEQGTLTLQRAEIDPAALVGDALAEFQEDLKTRTLNMVVDMPALPSLPGDVDALRRTLGELLRNAARGTPDGGSIFVLGRTRGEPGNGQEVELVVADTGIGIDPADLDTVFDAFARAGDVLNHSSHGAQFKAGGAGLGLALARKVVEAHGGRVWVESPGRNERTCPGSRVGMVLPLTRA